MDLMPHHCVCCLEQTPLRHRSLGRLVSDLLFRSKTIHRSRTPRQSTAACGIGACASSSCSSANSVGGNLHSCGGGDSGGRAAAVQMQPADLTELEPRLSDLRLSCRKVNRISNLE
jgi:hypothetical protein